MVPHDGGDIIGSRRATPGVEMVGSRHATPANDEGDIIGRRFNDRGFNEAAVLRSRWAASSTRLPTSKLTPSYPPIDAANPSAADKPPSQPPATLRGLNLQRIKRLIDRLSWKSLLLRGSQQIALNSPDATSTAAAPTTMFKLDFFEYYVLLERVIVLLLAFFDIHIPRGSAFGGPTGSWGHRYHANVLEKLDNEGNPLHEILGKDPVRGFLWTAKDFRNKWKDADEKDGLATWENQRDDVVKLHVEQMVTEILAALEKAYKIADEKGGSGKAPEVPAPQTAAAADLADESADMDMEDAPWEAVGDAMEWEVF
ncbi:uncharacterized protein K452DRAFT_355438 [Aplosporella prunicola CBS 121167]|uniref:Uncharacterized protein n=1 Tax=Aplosporella prunicola CBS 121167 TaxID=1176127 RepID=A0A6A6BP73_9PEZI|nr:uncharacterized protein K452DRAFT_355438 [Aplosporella prunicola CBS 121167]KAF2145939.1 hypothetical protein K452DRAFT_355438 [Aplosporella prunicola CBS 121167]